MKKYETTIKFEQGNKKASMGNGSHLFHPSLVDLINFSMDKRFF